MLLFLSELHKEHLNLLHSQPVQVLVNFCKLAIDYLNNGLNSNKYRIAAEKLGLTDSDVQNVVQAIVYLLSEGCKHALSEEDFKASLSIVGFSSEMQEVLTKLYKTKRAEISDTLHKLQKKDPTFEDLTWRFEVQVASRNSNEEVHPAVMMDLVLQTPKILQHNGEAETMDLQQNNLDYKNKTSPLHIDNDIQIAKTSSQCQNVINHILIQSDLPNLINMTNKLDQALKESKSQHVRKVQRALHR